MDLNPKQERFCLEYMIDFNGAQAAIRAGYSEKTAKEQASRMLTNVNIQERLSKLQTKAEVKFEISIDRIFKELSSISFSDIRNYYNEDGSLKPIKELDDESAAALAGVDVDEIWGMGGEDGESRLMVGQTKKIKRWDKIKAMSEISKMLGYYAPEKRDVNLSSETDIYIGGKKIPNG